MGHCHQKEIEVIAKRVAELCDSARGPVAVRVPLKGLSAFDGPDGPLFDPAGPEIFVSAFKAKARKKSCLNQSPYHINDPRFTAALFETLTRMIGDG